MINQDIVDRSKASQNKVELKQLLDEVEKIQPKTILEIGTWRGWLLDTFNEAFSPQSILAIDIDPTAIDPEMARKYKVLYADSHDPKTLETVKDYFQNKQIDFLFIDADHTYDSVKKDYQMYSPLVRPGGIIAFHDVALVGDNWVKTGVDVRRFWDEVSVGYKNKFIHDAPGRGSGTGILYI